jgi:hypothetical protein
MPNATLKTKQTKKASIAKQAIIAEVPGWLRDLIDQEARERAVSRSDIMRWALIDRYKDSMPKLGKAMS